MQATRSARSSSVAPLLLLLQAVLPLVLPTSAAGQTELTAPPLVSPPATAPLEDPAADRGFIAPTALTLPANTLAASNYELFVAGLTYAPLDRLQATFNVYLPSLVPGGSDDGTMANLSLKFQALRLWRFRLALMAGIDTFGQEKNATGTARESLTGSLEPRLGVVLSLCLTADCHSLLTAGTQVTREDALVDAPRGDVGLLSSASVMVRLRPRAKLMAEVTSTIRRPSPHAANAQPGHDGGSGLAIAALGLRVFGPRFALDLGVLAAISGQGGATLPYGSITWRF